MKIKELRESRNMTQEQLSCKLNVSRSTVAMWEIGAIFPRTDNLLKLCKVLGCTVDELLKGEEKDAKTNNDD